MKPIKTRKIAVYPKNTAADTQYWDMDKDDEAYIYHWLYQLMSDMQEISTYEPEIQKEWFRRRPGLYPKGRQGPNSHASILGGICAAKLRDPHKNLSTPQLDAVQAMMDIVANHYSDQPNAPESVVFEQKLFSI